jgi:hypothetical protein
MGARSYVPQLGRFLQPDPRPGGSANAYTYTFGDPVNTSDPSGEYTVGGPSESLIHGTAQLASEAAAEQAAINAAARAEAERKQREAEHALAAAAGPQYEGGEEEWGEEEYWEEEEGEYENAAYKHGESGKEEAHLEDGVLYQPLGESTTFNFLIWNEGHEAGSRCVQYGGKWKGHRCVGIRSRPGSRSACDWVFGSGGALVGGALGNVPGALIGGWVGTLPCG